VGSTLEADRGSNGVPIHEEGLATLFGLHNSLLSRERSAVERDRLDPERTAYLRDVEALLAIDPGIIKSLRRPPVPFEMIVAVQLVARGAPPGLAARLCRPTGSV
jgi:hypothetical protein